MSIEVVIGQMIQIFIMMLLGYFLYRIHLLDEDFIRKLTSLLVKVTMPALMLASVLGERTQGDEHKVFIMLGASFVIQFLLPVIAWILVMFLRVPKSQRGIYMFATTFSNVGFMGFPVIQALYGSEAVFYTALFNLAFNIAIFLFGVPLMNYKTGNSFSFQWKNLLSPGLVCSLLALVIYLCNIPFPRAVCEVCESIGGVTTPLAMLLIGGNLAKIQWQRLFNKWRIYPFTILKQIILPLLFWFVLKWVIKDEMMLGVLLVLIAMPVANNTVLFATEYHLDEEMASCLVFVTTVLSIITIPLVGWICF